jgi:hypothetical protein
VTAQRGKANAHVRAQSAARQQLQRVRVEATCMRACLVANGHGEVDETLRLWQAMRHAGAPSLGGYARSTAALGSSLDDAFSAVAVRPVGRAAQAPHR